MVIGRRTGDDADGATPGPFLAALVLILLVLIGIGIITFMNRGADSEHEAVVRAAIAQNDALQRLDYSDFRANTCAALAGTEAEVIARQRNSVAEKGPRYVGNVTAVAVDGDTATAHVNYYFDIDKDAKIDTPVRFVREDGTWRACTAGPGQ